jgi:hypothetical protein
MFFNLDKKTNMSVGIYKKPISFSLCYSDSVRLPVLLLGHGLPASKYVEQTYGKEFVDETNRLNGILEKYNEKENVLRGIDFVATDYYNVSQGQLNKTRTEKLSSAAYNEIQFLQFTWANADFENKRSSYLKSLNYDLADELGNLDGQKFSQWWRTQKNQLPKELIELKRLFLQGDTNGILKLLKSGSKVAPSLQTWMTNSAKDLKVIGLLVFNSLVRGAALLLKTERAILSEEKEITPTPDELAHQFAGMSLGEQLAIEESLARKSKPKGFQSAMSLI